MKKILTKLSASATVSMMLAVSALAGNGGTTGGTTTPAAASDFNDVAKPIVELINSFMKPLLAIVVAIGGLYCILLGAKFAKAEEPQEREKAKTHLKNAVIGFLLIFILVLAMNMSVPVLSAWVSKNVSGVSLT